MSTPYDAEWLEADDDTRPPSKFMSSLDADLATVRLGIEGGPDPELWAGEELLALQALEHVEAEIARLGEACNICGKPWPEHETACAYVGNVRDKEAAEREVARLREGHQRLYDYLDRCEDSGGFPTRYGIRRALLAEDGAA